MAVLVDGRMSPQEKAMDMSPDVWRVVSGNQGKYIRVPVYISLVGTQPVDIGYQGVEVVSRLVGIDDVDGCVG